MMEIKGVHFEAVWENDCNGKQDLDFRVLYVSTRYWSDFTSKPSIMLGNKVIEETYIEGETEEDCKNKTEQWIKDRLSTILDKLNS